MRSVGTNASPTIYASSRTDSVAAKNNSRITGTSNTSARRMVPAKNAATLHLLLFIPILKMDASLLQLNPWNSRASVSVANAMVLAVSASLDNPM